MRKEEGKALPIIIALVAIIIVLAVIAFVMYKDIFLKTDKNEVKILQSEIVEKKEETSKETVKTTTTPAQKKIQIFSGTERPIAVMIDNSKEAWPQSGLNDAYLVYEMIVEGGETRLMALFKGKTLQKIGPVRSSRHYFLDYAMENDGIYVHYGWSPEAEEDISKFNINNINGVTGDSKYFWRVKDKASPHNAVISTKNILELAESKGYKTTSNEKSVLNYVTNEVELENGQVANEVTIPYSELQTVSYKYNEETKRYTRYARGSVQKDWDSKEEITTKNIIITFAKNYDLQDGENKGRQELNNIGTLDGYYITNGKAVKIKCTKSARTSKTVYKDLSGQVINVNDGNTFIQICPIDADVKIQ